MYLHTTVASFYANYPVFCNKFALAYTSISIGKRPYCVAETRNRAIWNHISVSPRNRLFCLQSHSEGPNSDYALIRQKPNDLYHVEESYILIDGWISVNSFLFLFTVVTLAPTSLISSGIN